MNEQENADSNGPKPSVDNGRSVYVLASVDLTGDEGIRDLRVYEDQDKEIARRLFRANGYWNFIQSTRTFGEVQWKEWAKLHGAE